MKDLEKIVSKLAIAATLAPKKLKPSDLKQEWTKLHIIQRVLEALGWDGPWEVFPESNREESEGFIDYFCMPEGGVSSFCVEAKALSVLPPTDREDYVITRGLEQTKQRGASYFVWTNGDTWQFYSVALPEAPIYEIAFSRDSKEKITEALQMLERRNFIANPGAIDEAIKNHWMKIALSGALNTLQTELDGEFLPLLKRVMPKYLNVGANEAHDFLQRLQFGDPDTKRPPTPKDSAEAFSPCSEEWQQSADYPEVW